MDIERIVRVGSRAIWRTNQREGKFGRLGKTATGPVLYTDQHGNKHHGRNWARVNREGKMTAIVVVNTIAPLIPDLPVKIAQRSGVDTVIDYDERAAFEYTGGRALLPAHAWSHGRFGPDPLYITGLAFLPLAATPTNPASMAVTVHGPAFYRYEGADKVWETGDSSSLAAYVPSGTLVQHFVILCLDRANNQLAVVDGEDKSSLATSVPFTADEVLDVVETIADAYRTIAAIRLYYNQTTIRPPDIFMDLRPWAGELGVNAGGSLTADAIMTDADGSIMVDADGNVMIES